MDNVSNLLSNSRLLLPNNVITRRLEVLARQLQQCLNSNVILSPIREGGLFIWDMMKTRLPKNAKVIPIKVVSYRDSRVPAIPILEIPEDYPAARKHIILMDDIVDTGGTQNALTRQLLVRKALSVSMMCLLDKPSRRRYRVTPKFSGFIIPNVFVFGCGMDLNGHFRDLPEIRYLP